jgi:hypothetical protein
MRRVAEMGMMILICVIAMNSAIIVFAPSIGSEAKVTNQAPSNSDVQGTVVTTSNTISSISLSDPAGLILIPLKIGGAVLNVVSQFLKFFFAYNDIITTSGIPSSIASFINMFLNSVIIVVIFVTVLDIAIALRGISIG